MNAVRPGATAAIAYHNHEADQAHRQAMVALDRYNQAMDRLQGAFRAGDALQAGKEEAEVDAAWKEMHQLLAIGYQHRNSAAIAAAMAADIEQERGA